jgi:hypothetical protein
MTMCSMFIADVKAFDWKGGRLPPAATRAFPPIRGNRYHWAFEEWVKRTGADERGIDYDASGAPITKEQILELIEHCYGTDPSYNDPEQMLRSEGKAYLVEQLDELKRQVAELDPGGEYALVSECW